MKAFCAVILLASVLAACAEKKTVVAPTPPSVAPRAPRAPRPVKKELPPPPPLPLPQLSLEKDDQLREDAKGKVEGAERILKQIDQNRLAKEQQDIFLTVESFLIKAKAALTVKDFLRAFNLADKAQILAEELLQTIH